MDDNRNADQLSKAAAEANGRLAATTETVSDLAGKAGQEQPRQPARSRGAVSETAEQVNDAPAKTFKQRAEVPST